MYQLLCCCFVATALGRGCVRERFSDWGLAGRACETRDVYSMPRMEATLLARLPPEPTLPRRERDGIVVQALDHDLGGGPRPVPAACC